MHDMEEKKQEGQGAPAEESKKWSSEDSVPTEKLQTIDPKIIESFDKNLKRLRSLLHRNIIGQEALVDSLLMALLAGGHILVEGVPGLAKTLAVKTLAGSLQMSYKRIQFTPDLLPADLVGTMIFQPASGSFEPRKGPIFTQILLADEINRAPAKVQSALLEAMAEQQITIGLESHKLPHPFFVMATQNPVEEEGTYPLPAAELDRFDLKCIVRYPSPEEELQLLQQKLEGFRSEGQSAEPDPELLSVEELKEMQAAIAKVKVSEQIMRYIINIINATREKNLRLDFSRYIDLGASPRASLAIQRYAAIHALFAKRDYILPSDVKQVCLPILRHRIILSYEAEAENKSTDDVIEQVLNTVAVP